MARTVTTYHPQPAPVRVEIDIDDGPHGFALMLIVGGRRWGDSGIFPDASPSAHEARRVLVNERLVALMGSVLATLAIEAEAPFPVLTPRKS
jgi:hypothetical protein